jgi:hypothetical protein
MDSEPNECKGFGRWFNLHSENCGDCSLADECLVHTEPGKILARAVSFAEREAQQEYPDNPKAREKVVKNERNQAHREIRNRLSKAREQIEHKETQLQKLGAQRKFPFWSKSWMYENLPIQKVFQRTKLNGFMDLNWKSAIQKLTDTLSKEVAPLSLLGKAHGQAPILFQLNFELLESELGISKRRAYRLADKCCKSGILIDLGKPRKNRKGKPIRDAQKVYACGYWAVYQDKDLGNYGRRKVSFVSKDKYWLDILGKFRVRDDD